jgi:hypothetical protein
MTSYGTPADLPAEARTWAMASDLSALAGLLIGGLPAFVGPLLIWLLRKDRDGFTGAHALEALNFNLSVIVYVLVAVVLTIGTLGLAIVVVGPVLLVALLVYVVATVKATVRASNGELYRSPLSIRFLR